VAVATADRNFAVDENYDWDNYSQAVDQALSDRDNWLDLAEDTYAVAEAAALAARIGTQAQAERDYAVTAANTEATLGTTRAAQERAYRETEAVAYAVDVTVKTALDRAYWIYETNTMASVLSALAASTGTPWANSDANVTAAYATWVSTVAVQKETLDVAKATAQSTYEIAIAYGEEAFSVATAGADQAAVIAIADAELVAANAKALAISNLGLAGNYTAHPPTVPEAPDLGTNYAVTAAPAHHYWVTSQLYWYYGMWGYSPFALGLGGWYPGYWGGYYDYGYSGFGLGMGLGMGGMYYGGYYYVPPTPEVRLESGFWDIASQKSDVLYQYDLPVSESGATYAGSLVDEDPTVTLPPPQTPAQATPVAPSSTPALTPTSTPTPTPTATQSASDVQWDKAKVIKYLEFASPKLAEFWKSHGNILRAPFVGRDGIQQGASSGIGLANDGKLHGQDDRSKALEQVWVRVPEGWNSFKVAAYIYHRTAYRKADGAPPPTALQDKYERFLLAQRIDSFLQELRKESQQPKRGDPLDFARKMWEAEWKDPGDIRNHPHYYDDGTGGAVACVPRYGPGGKVVGSMGSRWTRRHKDYQAEDDAEKRKERMHTKLSLFNLVRGRYKAGLERELEDLKGTGGSPARIEEIQKELDLHYKYTKAIHPSGLGRIVAGGQTHEFARRTPRHEVRQKIGQAYSGAKFYRKEVSAASFDGEIAIHYTELSEDEFFGLTENELMLHLRAGIARSKWESDPIKHSLDWGQAILDWAGIVPLVGDALDVVNGAIYLLRGKPGEAALSAAAILPFIGSGVPPAKAAVKMAKHADEVADTIRTLRKEAEEVLKTGNSTKAKGVLKLAEQYETQLKVLHDAVKAYESGASKGIEHALALTDLLDLSRGVAGAKIPGWKLEKMNSALEQFFDVNLRTSLGERMIAKVKDVDPRFTANTPAFVRAGLVGNKKAFIYLPQGASHLDFMHEYFHLVAYMRYVHDAKLGKTAYESLKISQREALSVGQLIEATEWSGGMATGRSVWSQLTGKQKVDVLYAYLKQGGSLKELRWAGVKITPELEELWRQTKKKFNYGL